MRRRFRQRLSRNSVKESFDNLPGGVCFFSQNGMLTLCNRSMHRLAFALLGRDLQSAAELRQAIQTPKAGVGKSGEVLLLPDGSAWRLAEEEIRDQAGRVYTQFTAAEVTELYRATEQLREKNREQRELAAHLRNINQNVAAIMREQELLSMKMRVHAHVGSSVLHIRRYYRAGCPREQKEQLLQRWRDTLSLLRNEARADEEADSYQELLDVARSIGVEISVTGPLPEEPTQKLLLLAAMRECVTNAVRHGDGDRLWVELSREGNMLRAVIRNNGRPPKADIAEGGGLSALRKRIEGAGGEMRISRRPDFAVTVLLPMKGGSEE